jgi:hypothetical protein
VRRSRNPTRSHDRTAAPRPEATSRGDHIRSRATPDPWTRTTRHGAAASYPATRSPDRCGYEGPGTFDGYVSASFPTPE